ncbi:uncharacterized protein LOC105022425 isoform X3 [Esox lucius]|uniref:uncharacterized protein LOC105022425 isoform X3 n=1 Tax=Esox lucius TaxID=8010 RepID=UPI000661DE04|nr:uncharacterized protein LOC105022425 isoform X3 [Esox lucius]
MSPHSYKSLNNVPKRLIMEKMVTFSRLFSLLMASTLAYLLYVVIILHRSTPDKLFQQKQILFHISNQSITSVKNTKHFTVGAYREHRVKGHVVRIISIFRRDSVQPLYCLFCCGTHCTNGLKAEVQMHSDHFGFPFVTTDVLCPYPANCNPLLLGVQRVVIYNTSSGPDLKRLLQSYAQEGFVEVVQWPIDQHMDPSRGWLFSEHGGDIHYYGQLTTLNDCIYRHMYQSRYILLNDIDEIIVPYQHETLPPMMEALQSQHPKAEVFLIENHIFPKTQFDPSRRFNLPRWRNVPGINIMEHIYKEEPDYKNYHPYKIIVRPRGVEQTSVHEVLRSFGETVQVPPKVCHIIHVRVPLRKGLTKENLLEDKRVWDYKGELVSNVDKALERAGLLTR